MLAGRIQILRRVIAVIRALGADPRPPGCRKPRGSTRDDYRIRVGEYRVVYEIDGAKNAVRIMRVRHRREAYR